MASMSPRLGILNNIPFTIPFEIRVSIFRSFIVNDMNNTGYNRYNRSSIERVVIRRRNISQDGFDKLQKIDLKAPIAITFIDQFDQEEYVSVWHFLINPTYITDETLCNLKRAGIDGGGVFKEFLTSLCKEVFDSDRGLWLATQNNELYPNPHSYATECTFPSPSVLSLQMLC